MRIGTSRSDRIGFIVFVVLAALLATLVVSRLGNDSTESAQQVSTFADLDPAPAAPPAVETTDPLVVPTETPEPEPFVPLASPEDDEAEEPAEEDEDEDEEEEADASTADGDAADDGTQADAVTTQAQTAAPEPVAAADEGAAPNPQLPADTEAEAVPNPQLPADAEAASDETPNPQLPDSAPSPVSAAPVSVPVDAPAGGTFTHTLTATVSRPSLHSSAGGPTFVPTFNGQALPAVNPTVFGNALVYRVLAGEPGDSWAKVYVPARPNGTTAWVQTSQFQWGSSNQLLQINVTERTVTLFEGSNVILSTSAVLGKSSSPTPRANGWVEEIMAGPSAAFGPRLISLGIFSDALNTFAGGIPKIALHGTNNPGIMGTYASNGCIRVPNDVIQAIASRVRVGSKVVIVG